MSPSQFTYETQGLELVKRLPPDQPPFRAWSNFEFRNSRGRWHEVELLVLGRSQLHLVELKLDPASAPKARSLDLAKHRRILQAHLDSVADDGVVGFLAELARDELAEISTLTIMIHRVRLARSGNRQLNAAVHRIAITQLRLDGLGKAYLLEDDGQILLGLDATRARLKHLHRDPRVSLTTLAETGWGTHVSVQGRVVSLVDDVDLRGIDRLSKHYTGQPYGDREHPRVLAYVEIDRWHAWGDLPDNS